MFVRANNPHGGLYVRKTENICAHTVVPLRAHGLALIFLPFVEPMVPGRGV